MECWFVKEGGEGNCEDNGTVKQYRPLSAKPARKDVALARPSYVSGNRWEHQGDGHTWVPPAEQTDCVTICKTKGMPQPMGRRVSCLIQYSSSP